MNSLRARQTSSRKGFTIAELVVAIAIGVAAMSCIAQLLYQATRQAQAAARRQVVSLEVANIMEQLMVRSWQEITAANAPEVELSEACRQVLPEARLQLEILPEDDELEARRITVTVSGAMAGGQVDQSVRLTAWRYRTNRDETDES